MAHSFVMLAFLLVTMALLCDAVYPLKRNIKKKATTALLDAVEDAFITVRRIFEHERVFAVSGVDALKSKPGPRSQISPRALAVGRVGLVYVELAKILGVDAQYTGRQINDALKLVQPDYQCPYIKVKRKKCDKHDPYRSIDGICNNLHRPFAGAALAPFSRVLPAQYNDGISQPKRLGVDGFKLPNAREISLAMHKNSSRSSRSGKLSMFLVTFAQGLAHDVEQNAMSRGADNTLIDCCNAQSLKKTRPFCLPIWLSKHDPFFTRDCMNFVRTIPVPNGDCTIGPRQQLNQVTAFVDASNVYGSTQEEIDFLRDHKGGLLKTSRGKFLPLDVNNKAECILPKSGNCFAAGDVRNNENPGLTSFHTVFVRKHNIVAKELADINPHWDDERLFQETRKIISGIMQHVTYNEFLPDIVGQDEMAKNGLFSKMVGFFKKYNSKVNPDLANSFSGAAFRFGHSMVEGVMKLASGCPFDATSRLSSLLEKPDFLLQSSNGVSGVLAGLCAMNAQKVDRFITEELTNHLFEKNPKNRDGFDLAALNIQRSRDHGLPSYNDFRQSCGLPRVKHRLFDHEPDVANKLSRVYRNPDDLELFPAGISEKPVKGGAVGPTFACIIARQFRALKYGDRYWYERNGIEGFTKGQLRELRKIKLSKIILETSDILMIQENVFRMTSSENESRMCSEMPTMDLNEWRESSDNRGKRPNRKRKRTRKSG